MGPITVLDALEKRKFFCGSLFRNLVTILTDLTNKSKTTTTTTTTTTAATATTTLVMEAVEVVVQHQLRENKMRRKYCWRKVGERDCWKTSA
jgi:hypothetical protein